MTQLQSHIVHLARYNGASKKDAEQLAFDATEGLMDMALSWANQGFHFEETDIPFVADAAAEMVELLDLHVTRAERKKSFPKHKIKAIRRHMTTLEDGGPLEHNGVHVSWN